MKIIHVTPYYPPHLGGLEVCVKELAERSAKLGYTVLVYTSNKNAESMRMRNLVIKALPSLEFAHTPFMPTLLFELLKHVDRNTVLHTHTGVAYIPEITYFASRLKGVPFVVQVHGDVEPSGFFGFIYPLYKMFILKHLLVSADKVICLTNDFKESFARKYGISRDKIVVIPNGVTKHGNHKISPSLKNKKINLLCVGRLVKQKNIFRLLDSIKILVKKNYDVCLHIVGDGECRGEIVDKIKNEDMANRVKLYGSLDGDALLNMYSFSDIFVSSSNYEAFPLVMVEAMASGLPIVATDIEGVRELLAGCGALARLSPEGIADKVEELINNDTLRNQFIRRGKEKAKRFDWSDITKKVISLYGSINLGFRPKCSN